MKKFICLAVCMFFVLGGYASAEETVKKNKFQKAVEAQRESDIKRKNELIAKMKGIIGGYNKRLKQSGIKDANLDVPIDMNTIEEIKDNTEQHSTKPLPPAVYAFVIDDTNLFSSSDANDVIGKVSFAEKIEVLEKVEQPVLYKGHDGQWVAIRRSNTDEGWIHSSFLDKDKPSKKAEIKKPENENELSFDVPTSGRKSSSFGSRVDPVTHQRNAFHSGVDIAAPKGTPVVAAASGSISRAEFNKNGYGNLIVIEHAKEFTTYYAHLSQIKVKQGQSVKKGDNIGAVGSTGKSTGPHLHFEVRRGDKALDPDALIK